MAQDIPTVRDTACDSCGFKITLGVYAYMAGSRIYCQKCVRGPHPYGMEPTRRNSTFVQKRAMTDEQLGRELIVVAAESVVLIKADELLDQVPNQKTDTLF